jgi:hypothetical protein
MRDQCERAAVVPAPAAALTPQRSAVAKLSARISWGIWTALLALAILYLLFYP